MKRNVLVVDDELNMLNLIRIHLSNNYNIVVSNNGYEALKCLDKQTFDLIILDIMMPYISGWEMCEIIREKYNIPILMLTARNELEDKVRGLEIGADDYLVKPFAFEELAARVHALIRRSTANQTIESNEQVINSSGLEIHYESRRVKIENEIVEFTPKEFDLLWLLASNPTQIFTRELLLNKIWGIHDEREFRTVDTHIKNIRVKLRDTQCKSNPIKTVWGVGYKFEGVDKP
ncbi:response regulator transcription factor [Peribacillus frigoritolerans]|uniref:response regulator transcription factor n=1 Tax=Peribacillus frigoritolerans TaxID=450367 RepID=UPI0007BF148E|nr:response regulator transcription factor [Peribacillus frigoritolerans]USK67038.1 response regulator transcription factor [Peribacillus frigoritolerans]